MIIEGKVLIIKVVILFLFLFISFIFIFFRRVFLDLERVIFYFLWGFKWERLRRDVMKKLKEKGGKGVSDLYLFLGSRYFVLYIIIIIVLFRNFKIIVMICFWMGFYFRILKILFIDFRVFVFFSLLLVYVFI